MPESYIFCPHICFSRLVHAFTAAGIIPSQYTHFSTFAELGVVGKWYTSNGKLHIYMYT